MTRYESTEAARFQVVKVDGGEAIRIPAQAHGFVTTFIGFWLCLWTAAGYMVITQMMAKSGNLFVVFWLCLWALGWLSAASGLLWSLFGAETVRAVRGDLEISKTVLGFRRHKTYRGADITNFGVATEPVVNGRYTTMGSPFSIGTAGPMLFTYGARSVRAGAGLDEAEARLVVERIAPRLPTSAVADTRR